jgi:hypothetical protein
MKLGDLCDAWAFGLQLKAVSLKLQYPAATPEDLQRRLAAWLTYDE